MSAGSITASISTYDAALMGGGELGLLIAIVELDQEIAGLDVLVVGDRDTLDLAGDLRRDVGDVALDLRVVGPLLAGRIQ